MNEVELFIKACLESDTAKRIGELYIHSSIYMPEDKVILWVHPKSFAVIENLMEKAPGPEVHE